MMPVSLIVFDLDGVITDEKPYWDSAKEAVSTLLARLHVSSNAIPPDPLPQSLIYWLKNRAINNNWDVAYVAACAVLFSHGAIRPEFFAGAEDLSGIALLKYAGAKLASAHEDSEKNTFEYGGILSKLCHGTCQQIHDRRISSGEGRHVGVLAANELRDVLAQLHRTYEGRLGVATGRLRTEAFDALRSLGLLEYFDPRRIVTYDDIIEAEELMGRRGAPVSLGKPHPFGLLKVIYPGAEVQTLAGMPARAHDDVIFVGDTPSDVYAAKAARVHSVCVVGAVRDAKAKQERAAQLRAAGCGVLLESVTALPEFLRTFDSARLDEQQVGQ